MNELHPRAAAAGQPGAARSGEQLLGVREAARELGVNPSTVSRQLKAGILPNRGSVAAPKVRLSEALAARERNLDQSKQRGPEAPLFKAPPEGDSSADLHSETDEEPVTPAGRSGGLDFNKARTAREGFQARLAQIELEKQLGNLLDKAEVYDFFFALGQLLRETMTRRAPLLASRLVGLADLNAVTAILAEDDAKLQQQLADDVARQFTEGDANVAA